MTITIIDCYTDEPAGLGVPPYLGVYPRYLAGYYENPTYLTIDDIRLWKKSSSQIKTIKPSQKSDISTYNLSKNYADVSKILSDSTLVVFVLGVHVPGKYLSAKPGTLKEVVEIAKDLKCEKVLTGPGVLGTQVMGGKTAEKRDLSVFDSVELFDPGYDKISDYAVKGASILNQIPDLRIIEIETGKGCDIGKCSFCTEPLKSRTQFREKKDVLNEIKEFYKLGARRFRIGKQNCFYTVPYAAELLKDIRKQCPQIKVLHIDNVNPVKVVQDKDHEITKAIVEYCTPGNIAAFGVESFDPEVVKQNCLNTSPKIAYEAIKIINKYGGFIGNNGMQKFLPGINLIFGLKGETKQTHEENMKWLKKIYDENLLLRRINIRQVALYEGTPIFKERSSTLKKNKKYYWKWRNEIRTKIDLPMLRKLLPEGTILKNCYAEIYDGKTTFCRQFGSYPIIVGVKKRVDLKKFYKIKITSHMLRSVVGEVVE